MNLQQRLALIGKNLPTKPADANPFASMTDDELDKIGAELAKLVQAELDNDPKAIDTIDPRLLRYLKSEGLIKV
jgi:hypothetical protein